MTTQDRDAFGRMMFALGDTFNEPVSEIRVEAYFDALSDLETPDVLAAGRRAIAECRYFPRPVELRDMVEGSSADNAEAAWNELRRIVRQVGYYNTPEWPSEELRRAAMELYGGWRALCERLPSEGPEFFAARKAFLASYTANVGREKRERVMLPAHLQRLLE